MESWQISRLLMSYIHTISEVKEILVGWRTIANTLPEPLRGQALSSISLKGFHCYGGAVFSLYPQANKLPVLRLIVALQTISDYLDNLCDRLEVDHIESYRVLHESFLDAITLGAPLRDYYRLYPHTENIYLPRLIQACQWELQRLSGYKNYQHSAIALATHYCNLQTYKHGSGSRVERLQHWTTTTFDRSLAWYEWAAASGSTLGLFLLFAVSSTPKEIDLEQIFDAYFPWIQGLHILLDYLIDRQEDLEHGDLNFTTYYDSMIGIQNALVKFTNESRTRVATLPHSYFHQTVIDGLLSLYGSDPKVAQQNLQGIVNKLGSGCRSSLMLSICHFLRYIRFM